MANFEVRMTENNVDMTLRELDDRVAAALEAVGAEAERIASKKAPVDTGLLRNSITHALSGHTAAINSYSADHADANGVIKTGSYSGMAGNNREDAVYVGTNLEYAA